MGVPLPHLSKGLLENRKFSIRMKSGFLRENPDPCIGCDIGRPSLRMPQNDAHSVDSLSLFERNWENISNVED